MIIIQVLDLEWALNLDKALNLGQYLNLVSGSKSGLKSESGL